MKKFILIFATILFVACSTETKQLEVVRELAKKDAIEKLQLPDGTKFSNENFELSKSGDESIGNTYLVKVTVKSQDRDGNEILKTHTLTYEKIKEGGLSPEDYRLLSFE